MTEVKSRTKFRLFKADMLMTTTSLPLVPDSSFPVMIARLRDGDQEAATEVFRRFVDRLIALASRRLNARLKTKEDPEDLALSALKSFFRRDGRSNYDLATWEGLWTLLAKITVRKCIQRYRFYNAECREISREVSSGPGESEEDRQKQWLEVIGNEPTPEQATILTEMLQELTSRLNELQQTIAELFFEGYSQVEIHKKLGCSERTVGRVVARIREWLLEIESDGLKL